MLTLTRLLIAPTANNEEEMSDQWRVPDSGQLLVLSDTGAKLLSVHSHHFWTRLPPPTSEPSLHLPLTREPTTDLTVPPLDSPTSEPFLATTFEPTSPPTTELSASPTSEPTGAPSFDQSFSPPSLSLHITSVVVSCHHLAHSLSFLPAHHQPHPSHFFEKRSRSFST
jgi:hypothetical protein